MAFALSHIKTLLESLRANKWYITAFPLCNFFGHDYAVIFEDLRSIDRGSKYFAVELTFIDMADDERRLSIRANQFKFNHPEILYPFFGIITNGNSRFDPIWLIYEPLNHACPETFTEHPQNLTEYIYQTVNVRDQKDHGTGRCCYKARHNGKTASGKQIYRSEFNTAKTRLLRPDLYEQIGKDDPTISFCYRADSPLSDAEIILTLHKGFDQ